MPPTAGHERRPKSHGLAFLCVGLTLASCVAPIGPVEVTRFHNAQAAPLGYGTIAVEPAVGNDAASIEFRAYAVAVARELTRVGYREALPGDPPTEFVAVLDMTRHTFRPERPRGKVSVGLGGATGGYGSSVGMGVGIDLSGPPPAQSETQMHVMIRRRSGGTAVWEGRATFTVRADSPMAQTGLGSAKMAQALFKDFPGESGRTALIK